MEIYSYFVFVIRTGGTLSILTDKGKEAHPAQRHMTRRPGRDFANRISANHFPYDLMEIKEDARGDLYVNTKALGSLVPYQGELHVLGKMESLASHEVIWTLFMFDLIVEKFWKGGFRAKKLSYTGEMVRIDTALIDADEVKALAVKDYKTIKAPDLKLKDVTTDRLKRDWEIKPTNQNLWMEQRYAGEGQPGAVESYQCRPEQQAVYHGGFTRGDHAGKGH